MKRGALAIACAVTAGLIVEAAVFRVGVTGGDEAQLPDSLIPVLIAAAFLESSLLALPHAPAIAWPAVTVAATIASVEAIAVVRSLEPVSTGDPWRELSILGALSLGGAAAIATAYATRGWRGRSRLGLLAAATVVAGLIATAVAGAFAVAASEMTIDLGGLTPLRVAVRLGLVTMAAGFVVGLAADAAAPVRRAHERTRAEASPGLPGVGFVRNLATELLPPNSGQRRAAEAERARLAADLHALVLPELRRAAAAAESAGVPLQVQVDLRRALEDVEQLMHERQSVVLEQFGLVAALEWLAERTEERSPLRVELELEGDVPDSAAAVEPAIARAVFRIALLALDNVVRHAGATTATLRLSGDAAALRLRVVDDGAATAEPARSGRGLADMRAAARASGGTIEVSIAGGMNVEATWPRTAPAQNRAPAGTAITDRTATQAP